MAVYSEYKVVAEDISVVGRVSIYQSWGLDKAKELSFKVELDKWAELVQRDQATRANKGLYAFASVHDAVLHNSKQAYLKLSLGGQASDGSRAINVPITVTALGAQKTIKSLRKTLEGNSWTILAKVSVSSNGKYNRYWIKTAHLRNPAALPVYVQHSVMSAEQLAEFPDEL